MPGITVLLPVFNAIQTLPRALESLYQQTHPATEILVIDDGSTDGSTELLRREEKIRLIERPHRGIVPALNEGLQQARGDLIARMDADDICHPTRLEKQSAYLRTHPEIGLVGSRVHFGGNRQVQAGYAAYVDWINEQQTAEQIALSRFIESPFAHPSVMFRAELPRQHGAYRDGPFPEDYECWLRWMAAGINMAKTPESLLTWSDPPARLSRTDERYHPDAFYDTKAAYLAQWLAAHNPHHPHIMIWGAGRRTRRRAERLQEKGIQISHYIDLKPRTLPCGTPVIHFQDLPAPGTHFILPMVTNRGARQKIRNHLLQQKYIEGTHFIFAG